MGDDVVDLTRERTAGKSDDARFVARVLTPGEADLVREAPDPDLELWTLWACKEAAYKIHSKSLDRPPTFVHAAYHVTRTLAEQAGGSRPSEGRPVSLPRGRGEEVSARVRWDGGGAAVAVRRSREVVHAVAWGWDAGGGGHPPRRGAQGPPRVPVTHRLEAGLGELDDPGALWAGPLPVLLERLSEAEADPVHSRASAAVRLAARRTLAELWDLSEGRLEIVCAPGPTGRRPPSVRLDGEACDADVSFTHDGRWVAWSVAVPRKPGQAPRRSRAGS